MTPAKWKRTSQKLGATGRGHCRAEQSRVQQRYVLFAFSFGVRRVYVYVCVEGGGVLVTKSTTSTYAAPVARI